MTVTASLAVEFEQLFAHRDMLCDEIRCEAYRQALAAVVSPGDVVLDLGAGTGTGTGTGILSIFAAAAGAGQVYAVERTPVARQAERLAELNGYADRIRVFETDLEAVALAVWFSAELAPGQTLRCARGDPRTHWGRTICPLDAPVELETGSTVRVRFRTEPAGTGWTWSEWAVQIGDGPWREHDQRRSVVS